MAIGIILRPIDDKSLIAKWQIQKIYLLSLTWILNKDLNIYSI
jgi:hypothetical protein